MTAPISPSFQAASAVPGHRRRRALLGMVTWVVIVAGCGAGSSVGDTTTTGAVGTTQLVTGVASPVAVPTAVMSAAELTRWEDTALGFANRFNANFADAEAVFSEFSDDMVIYDPGNGDTFEGRAAAVEAWSGFARGWPNVEAQTTGVYLSVDAAAALTDVFNLVDMPDGGPLHEIRLYRFEDDRATVFELWYRVEGRGCPWVDVCRVEPADLAQRYLSAWSSGDVVRIGALYVEDAAFADSLLGIDAAGRAAIAGLGDERFGSNGDPACTLLDLYAQNYGGADPTPADPDRGQVIAVAIQFRCSLAGDPGAATDHITVLRLGTRQADGRFVLDPSGRILREEVFHDTDSLIAAGVAP